MKVDFSWQRKVWRIVNLGLFQLFVFFWLIKLFYCLAGYFTNGIVGVRSAVLHGMPIPSNPEEWRNPRWDLVIMRYVAIAIMTALLGWLNRQALRDFWRQVR